jgi:hypothetical protein
MRAADAGAPIALDDARPAGNAYRTLAVDVAAALGALSLQKSPFRVLA